MTTGDENSNTESNICFNDSRSEEDDKEQQTKSKTTFLIQYKNYNISTQAEILN